MYTHAHVSSLAPAYAFCTAHQEDYPTKSPFASNVDHDCFMWEQETEFNTLLVFAEHRCYGTLLEEIVTHANKIKFLITGQALADCAAPIDYLQKNAFGTAPTRRSSPLAHHRLRRLLRRHAGHLVCYDFNLIFL